MSLTRQLEEANARLQGGIAFLASVGSTAPFVGLFGTVWGILNALIAIGVAGQASIDKVAGPVGEALIMTAIGLAVAVPAVLLYNFLVRRNKVINEKLRGFASDLQTYLIDEGASEPAWIGLKRGRSMAMNVAADEKRRRSRTQHDHQYDAARRRHAGAAHHLPDHHPGDRQDGAVQLPNARNIATITKPENIVIAVDRDENIYCNNAAGRASRTEAAVRGCPAARPGSGKPLPEVHIRADQNVRFQAIGRVDLRMPAAQAS